MKRFARSSHLVDYLHKGVVFTAIGLTIWGVCVGGYRLHSFVTVTRPRRLEAQNKLLAEDPEEFKSED